MVQSPEELLEIRPRQPTASATRDSGVRLRDSGLVPPRAELRIGSQFCEHIALSRNKAAMLLLCPRRLSRLPNAVRAK